MEDKRKIILINVISMIMLAICLVLCVGLIIISNSKSNVQISEKSVDELPQNYTSAEEKSTTNTWYISATENDNVIATLSDDGILTISGTGNMKNWNSSATTDWYEMKDKVKTVIIENGVSNIGRYVFCECSNLTSIEIPSSVTSIGDGAFYNCTSLTSINIPEGVISIGDYAFYNCTTLTSIKIPEGVTSIEKYTFCDCTNLISIEIPEGVTTIGEFAFGYCASLTSIEIPESVTSLEDLVFDECTSLTSIDVNEKNKKYKDNNGVLYTKDNKEIIKYPAGRLDTEYTILTGVTNIRGCTFESCKNLVKIEIPESVTSIGGAAFWKCTNLTSLEVPVGVTSIETNVFYGCASLRSIEIPKGVTSIGNNAFCECSNLTSINLPKGVTELGAYAFAHCHSLTSINIPDSVTSIGDEAFLCCMVTKLADANSDIEMPNILKRVQDKNDLLYSSSGFNLTNCTIENNKIRIININSDIILKVKEGKLKGLEYRIINNTWDISATENDNVIATLSGNGTLTISGNGNMKKWPDRFHRDWHVMKSEVKTVIIEKGVTNIGDEAFADCENLTSIEIPKGVTSIGDDAFFGCAKLTTINLPESVTSIGNWAFAWCDNLTKIDILKKVTNIGNNAFEYCINLERIEVDENNIKYKDDNGVLYTKDGTEIIKYPIGKKETEYKILAGVVSIGNYAFDNCYSLINIEIPESVTSIGDNAFAVCEGLVSLKIPEGVIGIGEGAFGVCENLISVNIPESVTSIGEYAFEWCDNLTIICAKGSTAETYVKENEKNYIIMSKIQPQTTIKETRANIESNIEYKIVNKNNEEILVTAYTGTGYQIKVNGNEVHTIIVTGDCNGDGKSDIQDIFAINKQRLNNGKLTNEYLLAGDVNEDGKTNINDIFQINKYRLGMITEL